MSKMMDVIADPKIWRRIRQSVSPSFSNVQLEKMMEVTKSRLDVLVQQIKDLNGESINPRTVSGKYTMDAFLAAAMGFQMDLASIKDFNNSKELKYFTEILTPGPQIFLLFIFPGLGSLLDKLDIKIYASKAIRYLSLSSYRRI